MGQIRSKHTHTKQEIRDILEGADLQPTVQRLSMLQYILDEADHPTAEQVRDWASTHLGQVSQATVYNTLNAFVSAGILRQFKLGHSDCVIYDRNTMDHFHFLDEESGRLYDIHPENMQLSGKLPDGFQLKSVDVLFRGNRKSK